MKFPAVLAAAPAFARSRRPRYNVIVLMSDEHNPKVASPMNHPHVHTPHLERMAREGMVFERAYCPSPLCHPSRSAWLSGRRVHDIQCYSNCNVFARDYPTFGEVLAQHGVHTVLLGKTDAFRPGAELGFSECILPQDRARPGDLNISRNPLSIRNEGAQRAAGYGPKDGSPRAADDAVVDAAQEWLRTRPQTLDKPFVMIANITMPHFPHHVTQELWNKYEGVANLPAHGVEEASAQHPHAQDLRRHFQTEVFTEEQIRGHRRAYLGCVEYVDTQIGKMLATLEEEKLLDDTLFVYTSDHGEMLGKFGMWWKSSLYEDSVGIPLYALGGGFASASRSSIPVSLHDLRATIFGAAGVQQPEVWQGTPLHSALQQEDRVVFSEYHGHGTRASGYMIRQEDWKLLWYADGAHQLFNLREDPEELENLAEREKEIFRRLEAELLKICDPVEQNARVETHIARSWRRRRSIEVAMKLRYLPETDTAMLTF